MGREFFICEDAAFVTPVCPRLLFSYAVPIHLVKYCIQPPGIGRFDTILLCPHEDGQEQHLSSASIKFLWLRQIHDPSSISPALDNALSTLLSCCSQHFFPVRVLASFIHLLPGVALTDNDSKQMAVATSFRMLALLTPRTFSEGQKNLVNSENKENLSNYQVLKRKPSVCSTSLHFSKLITVVQIFRMTPVLQWFHLKLGAGKYCGRRPGTSALRMLLCLTTVKFPRNSMFFAFVSFQSAF